MKINWKVLVIALVMVAVVVWAVSSILPRSYAGENLNFSVSSGIVSVNNASDTPVSAQLIGIGSRAFAVFSTTEGISGSSARQGSGNTSTQLYEFTLPPGVNEFSIARGAGVNFVSASGTNLEATVQPVSQGELRTILVVVAIVVLGGLYYISRATDHRWIKSLRRAEIPVPVAAPVAEAVAGDPNRGRDGRMYSNYGGKD